MTTTLRLAALLLLLSSRLVAQPNVAYIIPDIGAENMNTAVEIIAPASANGSFGADGFYLNNAGDAVRVEPSGPRAGDIAVGPLVVSWNGRLISTQIFVRPGVTPGTIPLRVSTGAGFALVNFEIVNSQGDLNVSGNGTLGGSIGQRSKRGAMIVDRLILTGSNYDVSTTDTDGGTPGNQGYLPLIIIAREIVSLRTPTISVDASGKNGGAGGGGGGGQMCDRTFLGDGGPGTTGGDGFTGGGGGGRNYSGGASSHQSDGVGTGGGNSSLNSLAGGSNSVCYEGSGGGTGHPFGQSGIGWCGNGNPSGFYGGASTAGQNSGGGGAGYARQGGNGSGSNSSENRGRIHGNIQITPLAGGSGGASGNPQVISGGCGAEGGGGGGAIAIWSMKSFNSQAIFSARGADGGNVGNNADGGGGSGGSIVIGTKAIDNGNRSIGAHILEGGAGPGSGGAGGVGRFRFDGFLATPPTTSTSGATTFVGVSIDTLTYSEGFDFTLRGTRGSASQIRVYMKSALSDTWAQLPNPTTNGREWSLDVTASDTGEHYIVAFTEGGPDNTTWTEEPAWVTSQVAANIVRVESVPRIEVIEAIDMFGNPGPCPDDFQEERTFRFASVGTEDLNVRIEFANESTPGVFTVTAPPGITAAPGLDYPPDPQDTIDVIVRALPPNISGVHSADMLVITNDPRSGFDTVVVQLDIVKERAAVTVRPDTLDFGQLCRNGDSVMWIFVDYEGAFPSYRINDIRPERTPQTNPVFFRIDPNNDEPFFENPTRDPDFQQTDSVGIRFRSPNVGLYLDSFELIDQCDSVYTVYVKGEVVEVDLALSPGTSLNFRRVLVNSAKLDSVCIRNDGASPVTLDAATIGGRDPAAFRLIRPATTEDVVIPPGDSIKVVIEFLPTDTVLYAATLSIPTKGPCENVPDIALSGIGVEVCFDVDRTSLLFIADSCAVTPQVLDSIVTLINCGGTDIDVLELYSAEGKVTPTAGVTLPHRLRTGNETARRTTMTVSWDPADGTGLDSVAIVWQDIASGEIDTLWIPVDLRFDRATVELQTTSGDVVPDLFDIGGVFQCGPAVDTLVLVNSGTIEGEIFGSFVTGGIFTVDPSFASPYVLPVGGSQPIEIRLDPANAPTPGQVYEDTLVLVNGRCNQEWRVALRATRYELTVDVANVDFGATNLNLPRQQTITLTNTTVAPPGEGLVVERVYIDPPGASPPFDIVSTPTLPGNVLAGGGTFAVDATFTPTAEQVYTGRLCFEISEPCDTTICIDLRGEGIRSNIYVPQGDLSFGKTYYCAEDTLGLTVFSVGPVPLTVDSIRIVGPDAAGFEIVSLSQTPQVTLLPGFPAVVDSIDVAVRFIPANVPPDGPKMATLEIYSDDSAQGRVDIPLSGERTSPQVVGPADVAFGTVVVGQTAVRRITLTNTSDDPITIASPQLGANFSITTPLPLVIPAQGSIEIDIEFAPTDSEIYNDTLVGTWSIPCNGELRVPLTGEGLRGETVLSIPAGITGEPGERVAVPIILEEATALADVGATTVRVRLRFDKRMLLPVDADGGTAGPKRNVVTASSGTNIITASSGTIISETIDGEDKLLEVEFVNDPLPTAPAPLGFVDMIVLLGDELVTPISFDTIEWVDGEVASTGTDGEFSLEGYCDVGGARLVRIDGSFGIKAVAPNPIRTDAEITFETVENGPTSLVVYDALGREVVRLVDRDDLPTQAHLVEWQIDGVARGAYTLVLETPTQRDIRKMIVR